MKNLGSSIDDFLKDEGIFEGAQAQAVKEVVAWQLAQAMKEKKISKTVWPSYSRQAGHRLIDCLAETMTSPHRAYNERRPWLVGAS